MHMIALFNQKRPIDVNPFLFRSELEIFFKKVEHYRFIASWTWGDIL